MLIGFKRRFAPFVEDGSKTHTIRGKRQDGKVPKVGEVLHCYVDPRQKTMRLLGKFECLKVEAISIEERSGVFSVAVEGVVLDAGERNALAYRDGFRGRGVDGAFCEMMEFWLKEHGAHGSLRFTGHVYHWKAK